MEQQEPDGHVLRRWFSVGDLAGMIGTLIGLGVVWGNLSAELRVLQRDVTELQARDITPGARTQLAAIQATDTAMQQQINDIRQEMREQRREIIDSLTRVEAKLDQHDDADRR